MHETIYRGPPKVITAITSMSALLVGERSRREVRIPRRDQLPANIAWLKDENEAEYPAIIGMTGRVISVRDIGDECISQWSFACYPTDDIARERFSQDDQVELIRDFHGALTRIGVMPGSWYSAFFSVPMYGGNNHFESLFDCAGAERRRWETRHRASWNPMILLRRALGLAHPPPDPWLDDEATRAVVERTIESYGERILMNTWNKWSRSPNIAPTLRMMRVPYDDPNNTIYRPGNAHQRILANVPKVNQETMFGRYIPDDYEDAIERKLGKKA